MEILNAEQVGQRLNLSKQSVYRYARMGALPSIRIGKRVMFDWQQIRHQMQGKGESKTAF